MTSPRWPLVLGALSMATAVILAALGSHALPEVMNDPVRAHRFSTALQMQELNGVGLLLIGVALLVKPDHRLWRLAAALLSLGMLFFSGNLYQLTFMKSTPAGWLTPLGGWCLIAGWLLFAFGALTKRTSD